MFEIQQNNPHSNPQHRYEELERTATNYIWFQIVNVILIVISVIGCIGGTIYIEQFKDAYYGCGSPSTMEDAEDCRLYMATMDPEYYYWMKEMFIGLEVLLWLALIFSVTVSGISIWAYKTRSYSKIYCIFVTYIVIEVLSVLSLSWPTMILYGGLIYGAYKLMIIFREMQDLQRQGVVILPPHGGVHHAL